MTKPAAEPTARWVSFEIAGQLYGLAILSVQEVLASGEVEPVPGAPAGVIGVLNLRGCIVTVLDLRQRLGLPPLAANHALIVVGSGTQLLALAVDRVADVLNIAASGIQPPPRSVHADELLQPVGLVQLRQRLLTLLDADSLVPAVL